MKRSQASSSSSAGGGAGASSPSLRVAFLHPNLGIGGAERLVVDAASALQQSGHRVHLFTNYHDAGHCYEETRDGTLAVTVYGRTTDHMFGRFRVLIAVMRMIYLTIVFAVRHARDFDVVFVDQVSHAIPILTCFTACKVLFYCHFPDLLQSTHDSLLKRIYRYPFDRVEEYTTGLSDLILVNSVFTLENFESAFPRLRPLVQQGRVLVLHPSIDFARYKEVTSKEVASLPENAQGEVSLLDALVYGSPASSTPKLHLLTSINRFERKKNIQLAIDAFALYHAQQKASSASPASVPLRLLVCGGYDPVNIENREHFSELWASCERLGLVPIELENTTVVSADGTTRVELQYAAGAKLADAASPVVYFLRSFTDLQRSYLLSHSRAVLYTPSREHFGIVPVEAMYMRRPVVAVRSGGPKESVIDYNDVAVRSTATGFLCEPVAQEWTDAFRTLIDDRTPTFVAEMGARGRAHVLAKFHFATFQQKLVQHLLDLAAKRRK